MPTVMTKRGSQDNVVTYTHVCDTNADMAAINPQYINLGSTCLVVDGESGGLEVYIADSNKEWSMISVAAGGGGAGGLAIHICTTNEYDAITKVPTVELPVENTIYLVPNGATTGDLFVEWIYVDDAWEKIGSIGDLSGLVQDVQVNGTSVVQNGVANVPIATSAAAGVVKVNSTKGITISNGVLGISEVGSSPVQQGITRDYAITPFYQHSAAFYGLAKAAGADMKNIANPTTGTYPDAQKAAIQHMLGTDAAIADYEADTTADQAYAIGGLFMLNGKLHQATAAIAIGDTLTVGTNCAVVNIADVFPHDVKVNGTSVVQGGVANIDTDDLGIAQTVTDWLDQHVDPDTGYVIDDTLSIAGAAADAKAAGDELANLKSAITEFPDIRDSSATGVDLDLTDGSGNVIVRFKDGHIQTKKFDSASLAAALSGKQDVLTFDDAPIENSDNPVKSSGIYSAISKIENVIGENTAPVVLSRSGGFNTVSGEYCDPQTGIIYDGTSFANFVRSDYLPVSQGDVVRATWCRHYIYFDSSKAYVSGGDISSLAGYTGSQEENFITIPSGVAYLMVNYYSAYNTYGVTLEGAGDPEIVILGDSIYGIGPYPFNPCYYAAKDLRLNVADCAFGGTTAATHYSADYDKYSFHNIADCIASGDFSSMADFTGMPAIFKQHRTTLESVDWTKVKIVCLAWCTNDWDNGRPLDDPESPKSTSTYMGALRYGMETIWTEYPQIQFLLFGALYKTVTNDTGHDSDTATNINGKTLQEFIEGMGDVAKEYHQNFFDHYNVGFNSINSSVVFRPDGVHLSYDVGAPMLGVRTAKEIGLVLWEVR